MRGARVTAHTHAALPPTAESLALLERRHARVRPAVGAALRGAWPMSFVGGEVVPREGPLVVLANHVQFPDSLTMNVAAGRAVVVMGTEAMTQGPLGRAATYFGLSPKKKNVPDTRAVRLLKAWLDLGAAVGIFPEGERTWDGRPLPLLPGIEKLVLLMGAPVVTMRIYNGYRQWPRWAPLPRRSRVHVVVDPPVVYQKAQGAPAILADLQRRLAVTDGEGPEGPIDWPARGLRLARGITNVLYACPRCQRVEGLVEAGDAVRCAACHGAWQVTGRSTLVGPGGEQPLRALVDRQEAALADAGWRDPAAGPGALLRGAPCTLRVAAEPPPDAPAGTPSPPPVVLAGRLVLTPSEIRLDGADWALPLSEVAMANVENRRRLWIRSRDGRVFEPVLPDESVRKWEQFIRHHLPR